MAARVARRGPVPPMYLDWDEWRPVMRAYEVRRPAYFSTPPTNLVLALAAGLAEIESERVAARVARHTQAARALRAAWRALGLRLLPVREDLAADTLSALLLPDRHDLSPADRAAAQAQAATGAGTPPAAPGEAVSGPGAGRDPGAAADAPAVVARIAEQGVTVATGLLPELRGRYFRIGHMGWVIGRPDLLRRTVSAVAAALRDSGLGPGDEAEKQALAALDDVPAWGATLTAPVQ